MIKIIAVSAMVSTCLLAEGANSGEQTTQQSMQHERVQNETQNRFRSMSTDQLLEKRGATSNQQEREQLHNELRTRVQSMTQEQKRKFLNRPEKSGSNGMGNTQGFGGGMGGGGGKGGR